MQVPLMKDSLSASNINPDGKVDLAERIEPKITFEECDDAFNSSISENSSEEGGIKPLGSPISAEFDKYAFSIIQTKAMRDQAAG